MRECDLIAARAPFGRRRTPAEEADALLVRAVRVHNINLLAARTIALEHDLGAIGRIAAADVDPRRVRQLHRCPARRRHAVDVGVARNRHRIEDGLAIGRPARRKRRPLAFGHQRLPPGADIIDIDARRAVQIAEIRDLRIVGRIARGQRGCLPVGDETVVRPVRIHDRQLLAAMILRPGLGDVGDLAVEKRTFARKPRVDHVRAFVRRTPPFLGLHHIALPRQLAAQRDIVEIAAHRQPPIRRRFDEALHQHLGRARAPVRKCGRRHFAESNRGQRIGADWLEQAVVLEIAIDHPRQIPPQRFGVSAVRRSRQHLVGRKRRDGDAQVLPLALVGHRAGQPLVSRRGG